VPGCCNAINFNLRRSNSIFEKEEPHMTVVAVVGAQWGDEGKGRIIDELAMSADIVVRFQGGGNAGHHVWVGDDQFTFHQVPSGILAPHAHCVIGNGVVIDPRTLLEELQELGNRGIDLSRVHISDRAHVIMPYHSLLDQLEEHDRDTAGTGNLGTTSRGIGPAYVDKYARIGIRMADLLDPDQFRSKLAYVLGQKNRMLTQIYGHAPLSLEEIHSEYYSYARDLRLYIMDTQTYLQEAVASKKNIVLEGAQGALLDVDFGTYPYVTASSTVAGNASAGAGMPPRSIDHVIGVFKTYITRVGTGPLPTEQDNELGAHLRIRGYEVGRTTGRQRRCGWFDAVVGRYVARLNGLDSAVMMKLDVLDRIPSIKICTAYRLNGEITTTPPANLAQQVACEPIYEEMPGWQFDTTGITCAEDLPPNALAYVRRLEELLETPIVAVSVGPRRGQTIHLRPSPLA
jgi:adenylosuccinate synthase